MIGIDTNVLVRYLTQDDPVQSAKATRLIEQRLSEAKPGFISTVAIVETVWVLDRAYGFSAAAIASAVEQMLQADMFFVDDEQEVFTAMTALKTGEASFADALIAALGKSAGCSVTATFDRKAARQTGFELL